MVPVPFAPFNELPSTIGAITPNVPDKLLTPLPSVLIVLLAVPVLVVPLERERAGLTAPPSLLNVRTV